MSERYEILILGSGEAGKYLAWTMAKDGRRTGVVERALIGGSCPNIACLPSKNIIHGAKVASMVRRGMEFGIVTGPISIDMRAVLLRKRKMVDDLIKVHQSRYATSGAELILGEGRFVGPKTVEVRLREGGTRVLEGDRVFLNLGTKAAIPAISGLAQSRPLTHVEALDLDHLPEHLIVLGGGYVGLEFAQAMRRFGSRVTIVQRGSQLADHEDHDVADALLKFLTEEGIGVLLNAETTVVEGRSGDLVRLKVRAADRETVVEGSDLLVAAGRTPNTADIGLDIAGIRLDNRGYVQVNERLETSAPDVWAMGDCAGSPQFTHVAFDDFRIVRDNLNGGARTTRGRVIPFCMFTDPQVARIGLNESDARREGVAYRLVKIPITSVLRTRTLSETHGFLKALIDTSSDRILGFTALGPDAGELLAVVQVAMSAGMPYMALRDMILTHPTMAEGLGVLFADVPQSPRVLG